MKPKKYPFNTREHNCSTAAHAVVFEDHTLLEKFPAIERGYYLHEESRMLPAGMIWVSQSKRLLGSGLFIGHKEFLNALPNVAAVSELPADAMLLVNLTVLRYGLPHCILVYCAPKTQTLIIVDPAQEKAIITQIDKFFNWPKDFGLGGVLEFAFLTYDDMQSLPFFEKKDLKHLIETNEPQAAQQTSEIDKPNAKKPKRQN